MASAGFADLCAAGCGRANGRTAAGGAAATGAFTGAAALALGVSRSWLAERLDSCAGMRRAKDLRREDVLSVAETCAWNLRKMAERLQVSEHGLKLRVASLALR